MAQDKNIETKTVSGMIDLWLIPTNPGQYTNLAFGGFVPQYSGFFNGSITWINQTINAVESKCDSIINSYEQLSAIATLTDGAESVRYVKSIYAAVTTSLMSVTSRVDYINGVVVSMTGSNSASTQNASINDILQLKHDMLALYSYAYYHSIDPVFLNHLKDVMVSIATRNNVRNRTPDAPSTLITNLYGQALQSVQSLTTPPEFNIDKVTIFSSMLDKIKILALELIIPKLSFVPLGVKFGYMQFVNSTVKDIKDSEETQVYKDETGKEAENEEKMNKAKTIAEQTEKRISELEKKKEDVGLSDAELQEAAQLETSYKIKLEEINKMQADMTAIYGVNSAILKTKNDIAQSLSRLQKMKAATNVQSVTTNMSPNLATTFAMGPSGALALVPTIGAGCSTT